MIVAGYTFVVSPPEQEPWKGYWHAQCDMMPGAHAVVDKYDALLSAIEGIILSHRRAFWLAVSIVGRQETL